MKRVNLPVPVGNGIAAAVEVASFMAALKTVEVVVTANYVGSVHVEVSADGGVSWGPFADFTTTDQDTQIVCCSHMRVRVSGYKTGTLTAVSVGGEEGVTKFVTIPVMTNPPISPGTAVNVEDLEYIKTVIVSGVFHGSINLVVANSVDAALNLAYFAPWKSYTIPTTEEDIEAVVAYIGAFSKGAQPGDTPKVTIACSVPASDIAQLSTLPHNVDIFVDGGAAGFDGNPGTAALPVKTFGRALDLLPPLYTGYCRVNFARGNYFLLSPITGNFINPLNVAKITLPRAVGKDGTPVAFIGPWGVGTLFGGGTGRTVTAPVSFDTFTGTAVGFLGAGMTVTFTSGALSGQTFPIRLYSGTTYRVFGDVSAVLPGDTFDTKGPEVVIFAPDNTNILWDGEGGNAMSATGISFAPSFGGFAPAMQRWIDMTIFAAGVIWADLSFVLGAMTFERCKLNVNTRVTCMEADPALFTPIFPVNFSDANSVPVRGSAFQGAQGAGGWNQTVCNFMWLTISNDFVFGANWLFQACEINMERPVQFRRFTGGFDSCRALMEIPSATTPIYYHEHTESAAPLNIADSQVGINRMQLTPTLTGGGIALGDCKFALGNITSPAGPVVGTVLTIQGAASGAAFSAGITATGTLGAVRMGYPGGPFTTFATFPVAGTTYQVGGNALDGN